MKRIVCMVAWFVGTIGIAHADPFVGQFNGQADGDNYRLTLNKTGDGTYRGIIDVEGQKVGLKGRLRGQELVGEIDEGDGEVYQFVARVLDGGALFFEDEDGESVLFRPGGGAPAGLPAPVPAQAQAQGGGPWGGAPQSGNPVQGFPLQQQGYPQQGLQQQQAGSRIVINGYTLTAQDVAQLRASGIQVQLGQYWYDSVNGAWGYWGRPTMGFLAAGIPSAPLQPNSSNGNTQVFINGRNLPVQDLIALQQLTGPLMPGRYFIDQMGNAGVEGGPPLINLVQAMGQSGAQGGGGGGGGGGTWQSNVTGASGGYDGQGSGFVILKDSLGRPSTVGY